MTRNRSSWMWVAVLAGGTLLGGEYRDVAIEAQAGAELRVDVRSGAAGARTAGLPAGLRIKDGVVQGAPVYAGESDTVLSFLDAAGAQLGTALARFRVAEASEAAARGANMTWAQAPSASTYSAAPGQPVTFTAASASGAVQEWDFGDGAHALGAAVTHAYSQPGSYAARVTASLGGRSITSTLSVSVGGDARAGGPRAAADPLVKMSAEPFTAITLTGTGFDTAAETSVRFKFSKTISLTVDASEVTATSVLIFVPPLPKSFGFKSGSATLEILQGTTPTPVEGKLKVLGMPKLKTVPGSTTVSFLRSQRDLVQSLRGLLVSSNLSTPASLASLDAVVAKLGTLLADFKALVEAEKKDKEDKQSLKLLGVCDQFILGFLNGGSKATDAGFASACAAWRLALGSQDEAAILGAETGYNNALRALLNLGTMGAASRNPPAITPSGGIKIITGGFGIVSALSGLGGVILTAAGATTAGAGLIAVGVGVGTVGLVIGITAGVTYAVAGAVGTVAGSPEDPKLVDESKEVIKDIVKDKITEKITGGLVNIKFGEKPANAVEGLVAAYNDTNNVVDNIPTQQIGGSFTASLVRSGSSYFVTVTSSTPNLISVTVSGTDGFATSFSGTSMVVTSTIPAGATGVTDTVTVRDTVTNETQVFSFTF